MTGTFADLGLPFPLFEGPVDEAVTDGAGPCRACGAVQAIRFAETCYRCFRAGRAGQTIDTELGMVRPEDAARGRTHGIPLSSPDELPGWEIEPHPVDPNFPDERWYSVLVERAELDELLRTPRYHTWQGERWLFCCRRPMVFTGPLDPKAYPPSALAQLLGEPLERAEALREQVESGAISTYAFRCGTCGGVRAHRDRS